VSPQIRVHKIAAKRAKHQNLDEIRETNDLLKFCQKSFWEELVLHKTNGIARIVQINCKD
jgi:hypothetical protein